MSKEDIFEELLSIRTSIEDNPVLYEIIDGQLLVDRLQELIWKVGADIGEF